MSIFSRVGIPNEVLTDMGTQYTSAKCSKNRKVSFCNILDGYRAEADDFNSKGVLVWILASCL